MKATAAATATATATAIAIATAKVTPLEMQTFNLVHLSATMIPILKHPKVNLQLNNNTQCINKISQQNYNNWKVQYSV